MPEFIPEHTPIYQGTDRFTDGYLDAAEWLLDEEIDREAIEGWHDDAVRQAIADCTAFQNQYADLLQVYYDIVGRDARSAGIDLWLTRNHHGAGYWDRNAHGNAIAKDALAELTEAAHQMGDKDVYLGDDGYLYLT